jgi:hypothetical protein
MALTKISTAMISQSAAAVDLNVDAGTFYVDTTNNRVGVGGKTDPDTPLHVIGTATATLFAGSGASLTSIPNAALVNSSITINSTAVSLGGSLTLTTANIAENTNLYYTNARADARIAAADTDDLSEGSSNLYYTDARVDARVSGGSLGNITTTGYIRGPATFTLDPAAHGDNTGTVVIAGNLQVDGVTTTINSTTLTVDDKNITLASGSANAAAASGAGFTVDIGTGTNPAITYDGTNDEWDFNKPLNVTGVITTDGMTTSADINFGDNDKAVFGASSDLQIYHDGSHSRLVDSGTGNFIIQAGQFRVNTADDSEAMIKADVDGAVTLYHNHSQKIATTSTGIDVTGVITTDGMTTSADVNFGDNAKALFGAGSDLQIYHNGSKSIIHDFGTGNLEILADDFVIKNSTGVNTLFFADAPNGQVSLYHSNSAKLATTATGVDVTGSVTADGLLSGTTATYEIGSSSNLWANAWLKNGGRVYFGDTGTAIYGSSSLDIITFSTTTAERMRITSTGEIVTGGLTSSTGQLHLYKADATGGKLVLQSQVASDATAKITMMSRLLDNTNKNAYIEAYRGNINFGGDVGYGNVGIGTSSPTAPLSIRKVHATGYGSGIDMLDFKAYYPPNYDTETSKATIFVGTSDKHALNTHGGYLAFRVNQSGYAGTSGATNLAEAMRIEKDGNVGIGTSSPGKLLTLSRATEAQNEQLEFRNVGGISDGNFDGIRWSQGATGATTLAEQRINYKTTGVVDMSFNLRNEDSVLYLKAGGNIGIGTNAPGRKLHLKDGQIKFQNTGSGGWAGLDFSMGNGTYDGYMGMLDSDGKFFIDVDSNGNDFVILQNGNVGIGTDSPSVGLQVGNSVSGQTKTVIFNSEGGTENGLTIKSRTNRAKLSIGDNDTTGYLLAENSVLSLGFQDQAANDNINIKSGGLVGIGENAPAFRLQLGADNQGLGAVTTNKQILLNLDGGFSSTNSKQYKVAGFVGTTSGGTDDIFGSTYTSGEQLKNYYQTLIHHRQTRQILHLLWLQKSYY